MAGAIRSLLADPAERDRLARLALDRSRRFTWASAARSLLECFEELGPRPVGRDRPRHLADFSAFLARLSSISAGSFASGREHERLLAR